MNNDGEVEDDFSDIDAGLSEEFGLTEQGDAAAADPGTAQPDAGSQDASAQAAQDDGTQAQPAPDNAATLDELNRARSLLAAMQTENEELRAAQEASTGEPEIGIEVYTEEEQQHLIDEHGEYDARQMIKQRDSEVKHATDMAGLRKQISDLSQVVQSNTAESQLQTTLVQHASHMAKWRAESQQLPEGESTREFQMANANLQYARTLHPEKSYAEQLQFAEQRTLNDLGQQASVTTTTDKKGASAVSTAAVPDGLGQVAGGGGESADQALMSKFESGAELTDAEYRKLDDQLGFD